MEKSRIIYAKFTRNWLNFTEYLAYTLLYRKPFEGLTLEADVAYGEGKHEVEDFIYPTKSSKKLPVMIYIHGGGWLSGIKNMRRTHCYEYAKCGYFVANVDYSWAPEAQFPVSIQQCLTAVDLVFDNAEKYNLDTSKILLAGESAGAYYVAMLAAISRNKGILDTIGLTFRHADDFNVTVNMFNCGAFDIKSLATSKFPQMDIMLESFTNLSPADINSGKYNELIDKMSPVTYIDANYPPTFMLYATRDHLRTDTFALKKRFDALGVENGIYKCEGPLYGNHAFAVSTVTKTGKTILAATQAFVNGYIFTDNNDENTADEQSDVQSA